jgi:predicted amidohydrolase
VSTLRVTIVQSDLHWHDAAANRAAFASVIDGLEQATDLIVLPEMFTTGFTMDAEGHAENMNDATMGWFTEQAQRAGAALCGSLIVEAEGRYFNRFVFMRPNGDFDLYDKRHLFRLADEHRHYSAGDRRIVIDYLGFRICPQICYDLRFPVWSRNRGDYDMLIYVANWPSRRHHAWRTLLRARAIENQAYVAGVNRTGTDGNDLPYLGGSAIIDYLGEDIADLGDRVTTATATLELDALQRFREKFPFHRDADDFTIAG